jgi:hypothetical protein
MERLNSSPVPPNFRPRNTSPYTAFIRGRLHTRFGSAESWSNILCPNIRCVGTRYHTFPPLQRRESYLLLRGISCCSPFIGASPSPTPSPSPSPFPSPSPSPSVIHLLLPRCVSKEICDYCARPEKIKSFTLRHLVSYSNTTCVEQAKLQISCLLAIVGFIPNLNLLWTQEA